MVGTVPHGLRHSVGGRAHTATQTIHHALTMVILWKITFIHVTSLFIFCSCLVEDSDVPAIAKYFTTKGRYEEVNPHLIRDALSVNASVLQPPSAQCRHIHLTAIVRHGTRYPTTKNVRKMRELYEVVKSGASGEESWLQEIRTRWRMWYTEDMDGRLVRKGMDDHRHLAVRLSKLFPSLISEEKLRGGFIHFMTSSKHRCVNSTLSFKAGLTELWGITGENMHIHALSHALFLFITCFFSQIRSLTMQ